MIPVSVGAAVTVRVALPLTPFTVAVMLAVPTATAVASPDVLTVATEVLDELQVADVVTEAVEPSL